MVVAFEDSEVNSFVVIGFLILDHEFGHGFDDFIRWVVFSYQSEDFWDAGLGEGGFRSCEFLGLMSVLN